MNIQGKNKRNHFEVYDSIHNQLLSVDSQEEVDFVEWLCEAKNLSIINDFSYQPVSYQLSENIKYTTVFNKQNTLFQEHIYSPDFIVSYNPNKYKDLSKEFHVNIDDLSANECSTVIDVKGTFAKNDGGRSFSINQKWIYQKFKIYIYKLIPKIFFKKFGLPEKCKYTTKTKKLRKMFEGFQSIYNIFLKNKCL